MDTLYIINFFLVYFDYYDLYVNTINTNVSVLD